MLRALLLAALLLLAAGQRRAALARARLAPRRLRLPEGRPRPGRTFEATNLPFAFAYG